MFVATRMIYLYTFCMLLTVNQHTHLEIIQTAHAEAMFQLIDENRIYLREWLLFIDETKHLHDVEAYTRDAHERYLAKKEYAFAIFHEGTLAGRITLNIIDPRNKTADIAYWLGEAFQGKGIMLQSCQALLAFGFKTLQLNRIEIRCDAANHRSMAIPAKLHFTYEGTQRQRKRMRDAYADIQVYSLLHSEFDSWFNHNTSASS